MSFLGQLSGPVTGFCYNLTKNYGPAIILFTLFSKIILLPISAWVQKNSITMVKIEPDVNRINIRGRNEIDMAAALEKLNAIPEKVDYMLNRTEEYHERIDRPVHEYVYHSDESAPYDAQYIIEAVFRKTEERNGLVIENA